MLAKFTLWKNDKGGKQPVFKGFITIDGTEHEIAVWNRDKGGWTGKIGPKQERQDDNSAPF